MEQQTKRCSRCKQELPIERFGVVRSGVRAGRRNSYCKSCSAAIVKQWNIDNPERTLAARQRYQQSGKYKQAPWYIRQREELRATRETRLAETKERRRLERLEKLRHDLEHGKTCIHCGEHKPYNDFAIDSARKPHPELPNVRIRMNICKKCRSKYVWEKEKEKRQAQRA